MKYGPFHGVVWPKKLSFPLIVLILLAFGTSIIQNVPFKNVLVFENLPLFPPQVQSPWTRSKQSRPAQKSRQNLLHLAPPLSWRYAQLRLVIQPEREQMWLISKHNIVWMRIKIILYSLMASLDSSEDSCDSNEYWVVGLLNSSTKAQKASKLYR